MTRMSKLTAAVVAGLGAALLANTALADRDHGMDGRQGGAPMAAFDFAAVDADKDGKITPAEITAYRTAQAKAADTDGDGLMSADELAAMHVQGLQARATEMATRMIERQDTDGDGKLSAAEMTMRPMPARMFERMDTDNDGALSEAEITAAKDRMAEGHDGRMGKRQGRGDGHGRGHGGQDSN